MNINNRKDRVLLAEETLKICETGEYISHEGKPVSIRKELDQCLENTKHYKPEETEKFIIDNPADYTTRFEVTGETTLQAAERMNAQTAAPLLALNFASAKNPGGGFLGGSMAQEESIARSSGLYPSLLKAPDYYSIHRNSSDLLYTDHMIYSPGVPVFRNDEGKLLGQPYLLSIITSPATNKGALLQNNKPGAERIEELMTARAGKVLKLALQHGYRHLILGAWGCGVFMNDPALIAGIFKKHLSAGGEFENAFEQIVFAVYDRTNDQSVITPFRELFADLM